MCTVNINLNPLVSGITEGISIFTACRNRSDHLEKALQTWIRCGEVDEIIVLDWSSEESLKPLIDKYQNGKIILAEAPGQNKWILSHAYNLAARLTTKTKTFKIDADIEITGDFFWRHKLSPGHFFSGNWRKARNPNENHLNGTVYLLREDFFKVNGYNEFIKKYGWDDCNFYERLEASGLQKRNIDLDTLRHIEHEQRMAADLADNPFPISDEALADLNIQTNRLACKAFPDWLKREMMEFDARSLGENHLLCEQRGENENIAPKDVLIHAEETALRQILAFNSKYGLSIPEDATKKLQREELSKIYTIVNAAPSKGRTVNGLVSVTSSQGSEGDISGLLSSLSVLHTHFCNAPITETHVFYVGSQSDPVYAYLKSRKNATIISREAEPTLEEFLHYSNELLAGRKVIISNTTIDFNEIIESLAAINFDSGMFSLVKWSVPPKTSASSASPSLSDRARKILSFFMKRASRAMSEFLRKVIK